jgi:dye decolorizing peroxidase
MDDARISRRRLLQGGAVLAGGATLGAAVAVAATSDEPTAAAVTGGGTTAFRGEHQAGVTTPQQAHTWFVALDLREAATTDSLARLLRIWTDDIERLMSGRAPLGDQERELATVPARLTVTVGVGATGLARVGMAARRPSSLGPLPAFEVDRFEPGWGEADLLLQVGADDVLTVSHAVRVLTRDARPFARTVWVQRGFVRSRGAVPEGETPRNLLGQIDGSIQPAADKVAATVWADGPDWFRGGTMLVLRRIRLDLDRWEALGRVDRDLVLGRRLTDGSPLTGGNEKSPADLEAVDAFGLPVVPDFAHIRQAKARSDDELMLRRGCSYDDTTGMRQDAGLIFAAFVADVDRQFVPVQRRLAENDLMNRWTTPVGSSVFAILPGTGDSPGAWLGQSLLA